MVGFILSSEVKTRLLFASSIFSAFVAWQRENVISCFEFYTSTWTLFVDIVCYFGLLSIEL